MHLVANFTSFNENTNYHRNQITLRRVKVFVVKHVLQNPLIRKSNKS